MAALTGGEMCVKYLMFAFNFGFWVSARDAQDYYTPSDRQLECGTEGQV